MISLQNVPPNLPTRPVSPRFSGGLDRVLGWLTNNLYDKGDGFRYAFEQTLGYTVPRTSQQLYRTYNITGKPNKMAAAEMLLRDLIADITDTFLPGILATPVIGFLLDKTFRSLTQFNIPRDTQDFFSALALNPGASGTQAIPHHRPGFYQVLGRLLQVQTHSTVRRHPHTGSLHLEKTLAHIASLPKASQRNDAISKAAFELAETLKLSNLDVSLSVKRGTTTHALHTSLPDLIRDLSVLERHFSKNTGKIQQETVAWGNHLIQVLAKTRRFGKYQMLGNVLALISSISAPFAIRLITRKHYGVDAFPGTHEIKTHFRDEKDRHQMPSRKFELFPYLSQTLREGKILPSLFAAGFFGVLGAMVLKRFKGLPKGIFSVQNGLKVYQFDRHFPWTTIAQMELTYGLLVGIRLLASRDGAEYRETLFRDCMLGWPLLTYFFPSFRLFLSKQLNAKLARQFKVPHLLVKPNVPSYANPAKMAILSKDEITPVFFKNLGLSEALAKQAVDAALKLRGRVAPIAGAVSLFLLSVAEPRISISITNMLERNKYETPKDVPQAVFSKWSQKSGPFQHLVADLRTTGFTPQA